MNNELIEAAKAVIARWDSTDWESAPTIHAMNRLRAALSKEPAKLPEVEGKASVLERLRSLIEDEGWLAADSVVQLSRDCVNLINTLAAAHAAELNNLHAQIGDILAISATAKEQGRREALAYDPPIPNEIKGRVQAEWFWKGVLAMKQEKTK